MSEQGFLDTEQAIPIPADSGAPAPDQMELHLKKVAKNAGIAGFGNIIGFISAPITGIITTRALGVEFYGIYSLATYWTNLLAGLSNLGLGGTITRFIPAYKGRSEPHKIKGVIELAVKIALIFGLLFTVGILLFASPFCTLLFKRPDAAAAFRFFAPNILFTALYGIFLCALTGFQRQDYVFLSNSLAGNFSKIFSLIVLLLLGLRLYAALLSSLIQDMVLVALTAYFLLKVFPPLKQKNFAAVVEKKEVAKFSSAIFANSIFNRYTFQLDVLFLGFFRPVAEVGLYSVALRLQPLIYFPHYALSQIFGPLVAELHARNELKDLGQLYKTVTKWTATFSLPIFGTLVLFHNQILNLFGKDFRGSSKVLVILAFGNAVADTLGMSGQVIQMIGRPFLNLLNSIITSIVTIGLFILMIPKQGMLGAAMAYTISISLLNAIRIFQVHHLLKIQPLKWSYAKIVLATILATGIFYLISKAFFVSKFAYLWVLLLLLYWIFYVVLVAAFRFDKEDRIVIQAIKTRLKGAFKRG